MMINMDFSISDIIQLGALLVVSLQAYLIYRTLLADHERRRKQATLDFFNAVSGRYKEAIARFNDRHGRDRVVDISDYTDEDLEITRAYLNEIEYLSAGVNCGVLDYELLKRMSGTNLKKNHLRFGQFISSRQKVSPTAYSEFDSLVFTT